MSVRDKLVLSLGLVPQNLVSYAVCAAVRLKFPQPMLNLINLSFVSGFGLNMGEASQDIQDYNSIEEIFTRALKPDQRTIEGRYVASADGILERSEASESGDTAIQAKGLTYSLSEVVTGDPSARIDAQWYTTTYLAPHNYHRVHAPFSGKVTRLRYIPGRLWPVNKPAVRTIANLFGKNERLVFDFELEGGGLGWVVMVGAFNVGRMTTRLDPDFVTNAVSRQLGTSEGVREIALKEAPQVNAGDELGIFMLGSTTVVVLDSKARQTLNPVVRAEPATIRMGQSLSQ
jgi:phosphatidylserine decarboxylase